MEHVQLALAAEHLEAENARLTAELTEALDEWDNASLYKGEYLRNKHGDVERIAALRPLATPQEPT